MIAHGYLPSKYMDTFIIPIVKDKRGDITDGDNYRPIAIISVNSKNVELIILDKFLDKLGTTSNQSGFKNGLSCGLCIFHINKLLIISSPEAAQSIFVT